MFEGKELEDPNALDDLGDELDAVVEAPHGVRVDTLQGGGQLLLGGYEQHHEEKPREAGPAELKVEEHDGDERLQGRGPDVVDEVCSAQGGVGAGAGAGAGRVGSGAPVCATVRDGRGHGQ